ncbi:uncharacterized protein LOC127846465 isoform X2 [Dreissena polymorpha]|uniref:uncharacterized protein LOC127846465 isoform X2 n=1 Tax=Dreissena polymorpha TaxID=45954 RepID=UPI002264B8CC|nr:uncharacterized protein LOC127846465 isoform X2 [Dreissena polymorpha]
MTNLSVGCLIIGVLLMKVNNCNTACSSAALGTTCRDTRKDTKGDTGESYYEESATESLTTTDVTSEYVEDGLGLYALPVKYLTTFEIQQAYFEFVGVTPPWRPALNTSCKDTSNDTKGDTDEFGVTPPWRPALNTSCKDTSNDTKGGTDEYYGGYNTIARWTRAGLTRHQKEYMNIVEWNPPELRLVSGTSYQDMSNDTKADTDEYFDIIGGCKTAQAHSPPGRGRSSGIRTASRKAVNVHSVDSDESVSENNYDAVVWYNQNDPGDNEFLQELIEELEGRRGIRLYVTGRDDLSDAYGNTRTAQEIERRCRRAIIVVSRSFLQSTLNDFQRRFAKTSTPGSRIELFPITREDGVVVPRRLQGRNTYDLSNTNMVEATWDRLTLDIRAWIGPESHLGQISHPDLRSVDESNQTTPKDVIPSRHVRPAGLNGSSAPITPETYQNMRTDLQMLLKKRKTTDSVHNHRDLTPTEMHIETPLEQVDETEPKRLILSEDQSESMFPEMLEYQHQPTTWMLRDEIARGMPSQNLTLAHSGDQTSYQTPPLLEDRTSSRRSQSADLGDPK